MDRDSLVSKLPAATYQRVELVQKPDGQWIVTHWFPSCRRRPTNVWISSETRWTMDRDSLVFRLPAATYQRVD